MEATVPTRQGPGRCEAAHHDDQSPCVGTPQFAHVVDEFGRESRGCVWHALVLAAVLDRPWAYPGRCDPAAAVVMIEIAPMLRRLASGDWNPVTEPSRFGPSGERDATDG